MVDLDQCDYLFVHYPTKIILQYGQTIMDPAQKSSTTNAEPEKETDTNAASPAAHALKFPCRPLKICTSGA
jgi:hypothetical protein